MASIGTNIISSMVFCSNQLASQAATNQMVGNLRRILTCIPMQHFPSIINCVQQQHNNTDRNTWCKRIRNSILQLMVCMIGCVDARICALADCAYKTADVRGPRDSLTQVQQGGQAQEEQSKLTLQNYKVESDKIKLHPLIMQDTILIDRLQRRLMRICNQPLSVDIYYYIDREGKPKRLNHVAFLLRTLPDIVSTTHAVMADMMCEIITRALPELHSCLPTPLRWKFTFDAECTPPSVSTEIDKAVWEIFINKNLQEAIEDSAQKALACDFSYYSICNCAESLAHVVSAGIAERLEQVDIRRSVTMGWTVRDIIAPPADTLSTAADAAVAASESMLTLSGPFLKSLVMESREQCTHLIPSGEAELDMAINDRVLKIDIKSEKWTVGAKVHTSLLALAKTAWIRASTDCLDKPFSIIAAVGVVERNNTCFFVPKGVFTIVFCSSQDVLNSIYDKDDVDRAYCIIPPNNISVRRCMLSLCNAYNLPYFLRMPLVPCHLSLFYETISSSPLPLRRLPLQDPCIAIKQMACMLEWLGSGCDGVLFGDFAGKVVLAEDALSFGVINAKTSSSVFVSWCFNFI
jgi:hypothetical protein